MTATRLENVKIERAADEILAVNSITSEAHAINQSAAAVFDLCDGKTSKAEMAAEIHRRTGLPADEEIVDLALSELADAGLITLDESEPQARTTRRSLIRRFSLTAAAVAMLPVVETILVPTASAAGSGISPAPIHHTPTPTPTPVPE
jgi:coenzyme PQQ synthesis protein D (PqqD)